MNKSHETITGWRMLALWLVVFTVACWTTAGLAQERSDEELAKMAQNPLANLMSLPFQNNSSFGIGPYDRTQNVLNIQPVIPVFEGRLLTRTILPVVWQPDVLAESGTSTGLGDLQFTAFYVPPAQGLMWGVGPIFAFPTGGSERGTGKWSAGASILGLITPGQWVIGALVNNIWSYAGKSDRADVNMMTLQYFINYNFPGFYLTTSPIITANWEAPSGQEWTVPFGLGIGKVFRAGKLPLNCQAHYYRNVESPDFGADWSIRLQIQMLLPMKRG